MPTGPCPTPSFSAAAVFVPAKTIFCLHAVRGNARVTLTWQPAIPERLSSAFFVYYQATDTEVVTDFGAVTGDKVAVPDLTNGTAYVFWIARGESANAVSNGVRAFPATVPDEPAGLTATAASGRVTLDWAAPVSDGGVFAIKALLLTVSGGRIAAVRSGSCDITVSLAVQDTELITRRKHLELPGVMASRHGFRLLPAAEYPAAAEPPAE